MTKSGSRRRLVFTTTEPELPPEPVRNARLRDVEILAILTWMREKAEEIMPERFNDAGFNQWVNDNGFHLIPSRDIQYDLATFTQDTHRMYLDILSQRYQTSQVLRQVRTTLIQQHFSSCVSISSSNSNPSSPIAHCA